MFTIRFTRPHKISIALITLSLLTLITTACSSNDGGGSTPPPSPPPTIISVTPEENSDTALVTTTVSILFGIDMDKPSVENSFTVKVQGGADVTGTVVYTAGTDTALFTPDSDLTSGTQYTATLSSAVLDATADTPLNSDYVWSFTVAPTTVLVSTDENGSVGPNNTASSSSDIDGTGRYIVFSSAEPLTTVATGGIAQIYRKDSQSGYVRLISTADGSTAANIDCFDPVVNATGRYIAFTSQATNLSPLNNNAHTQIFLKDMQTGDLKMISTNTTVTSGGNRNSSSPAITNNGRLIAFHSEAFNLVPSDPNGDVSDVFVYNSQSISMSLVSLDSAGADTNAASSFPDISDDGQYVVFESLATDLGSCTTGQGDIFVRDTVNDTNTCISIASGGGDANAASITPVISGDGSSVVFASSATNLLPPGTDTNGVDDIFIRDSAALNPTLRISLSETGSETSTGGNALPSVSANGRYVAFVSSATDLVANDTNGAEDVFVRDTQGGNSDIVRVSVDANGNQGVNNDASGLPSISDDGRYISFSSNDVLDAADTNGAGISDVYRGLNATFP